MKSEITKERKAADPNYSSDVEPETITKSIKKDEKTKKKKKRDARWKKKSKKAKAELRKTQIEK